MIINMLGQVIIPIKKIVTAPSFDGSKALREHRQKPVEVMGSKGMVLGMFHVIYGPRGKIMAMLILLLSHNIVTAILFGIVRGIVQGFEAITLGIIWPNFFGRKHLGSINGGGLCSPLGR